MYPTVRRTTKHMSKHMSTSLGQEVFTRREFFTRNNSFAQVICSSSSSILRVPFASLLFFLCFLSSWCASPFRSYSSSFQPRLLDGRSPVKTSQHASRTSSQATTPVLFFPSHGGTSRFVFRNFRFGIMIYSKRSSGKKGAGKRERRSGQGGTSGPEVVVTRRLCQLRRLRRLRSEFGSTIRTTYGLDVIRGGIKERDYKTTRLRQ